ncbi:Hypothetical protein LUCI_5184 [Lucifera butyrica]|uniref:Fumarylacetoacetase-like C-terminal domain-containing protein n=1 Tax=Lucifera butyrica TaxID=1351585 RepID=A0A498RAX0_9FIRM|nr:fumarylacetoacetate hydrolase family protein [Lucifera butyrica]VBB09886.1 Hypothetical protein LUCI_5184 [Lucifera butyrica]
MYLATYEYDNRQTIGLLAENQKHIIPLNAAEQYYLGQNTLPAAMLDLIRQGDAAFDTVRSIAGKFTARKQPSLLLPVDSVRLKAPIPRPAKNIFCVGKNYAEHAMEFDKTKDPAAAIPQYPVIFTKPPTTVTGPDDPVSSHSGVTGALDYEVELAVIIGKQGCSIAQENAMDHVFGFTILNDVTARDLQSRHLQWFLGKSLDTFAPMGPYLVHKSAVADPGCLDVCCKINGEIRQQANTRSFIFDIPTLISTISAGITLEPGDIISTGTPAGVGAGFIPPKFLQPGDLMECSISGLGTLRNKIV